MCGTYYRSLLSDRFRSCGCARPSRPSSIGDIVSRVLLYQSCRALTFALGFLVYICDNPSYVPAAKFTVMLRTGNDVCSESP